MATHRRRRQGPQRRRAHLSVVPAPEDEFEPELIRTIRRLMREPEPVPLLTMVSGLLTAVDQRHGDPFHPDPDRLSLVALVDSFIDVDFAETTAVLTVMAALVPDAGLASRIEQALRQRRQPMPDWLRDLGKARVDAEVWFLTDVLGDGDDYLVGLTLASGHPLTALVYVDHNLGTVVKDAFVVGTSTGEVVARMAETIDAGASLTTVDGADARAAIERAIEDSARLYPQPESEQWPMCRPLVEWMVRRLPSGGAAPELHEWTEHELAKLAREFWASPMSQRLDGPDDADILDTLLWFGSGYCGGDPLRWSPVNVEILLMDWVPRKIVADPDYLSRVPTVLRALIEYCHDARDIPSSSRRETLDAVGRWEPEYQVLIRSARPQGPAAILAAMGLPVDEGYSDMTDEEFMLSLLDARVGGREQLQSLDTEPLPDEPFGWSGIPDDIRPVVEEMLRECDRVADEILDVEYRTAMRRFLHAAAVGDPSVFRRKASPSRGAAAVAWIIFRANDDPAYRHVLVRDLLAAFGVTGPVSQRADPLLAAVGIDPHSRYGRPDLGTPDLLTGSTRARIIDYRDRDWSW